MKTITGKLRIVTLKGGGANLSIDLDPNTDWDKLMPVLFNMALHPVSISPAGFEAPSEQSDPLERAQIGCQEVVAALLELSEGMERGKQPELALRASEGEGVLSWGEGKEGPDKEVYSKVYSDVEAIDKAIGHENKEEIIT